MAKSQTQADVQSNDIAELMCSPAHGFFQAPMTLSLACPTPGVSIRYTTNGSAPAANQGSLYHGPIRLQQTTILRARAFREGWRPSKVLTHTYLFLNEVMIQNQTQALAAGFPATWNGHAADYELNQRVVGPAGRDQYGGKYACSIRAALLSLPTLSVVMDPADLFGAQGIYLNPENHGADWEKACSVEFILPDHRPGFQENAGLRIHGGAFRRFDLSLKKSFRLVFRQKYGNAKLRYPLFGAQAAPRFQNIVLRAGGNDAWAFGGEHATYARDAFAMETARALGMKAPHTMFVHLYLNGLYWGLYNPVERPDAAFSATYHGGNRADWDALNQDSIPDGNDEAWNRLLAQFNRGLSPNDLFHRLQGNRPDGTRNPAYESLIHMESLIDYMILNLYMGNSDWPGRNWWVGRNRQSGTGFYFYPWDTETSLGLTGLTIDRTGVGDAVAHPYEALRASSEFRRSFAARVARHFSKGGALYVNPDQPHWNPAHPENNQPAARFHALAQQIHQAVVAESARWGDQMHRGPYTRDEHWQRECDRLLTEYFPRRSAIVIEQFRRADLLSKP